MLGSLLLLLALQAAEPQPAATLQPAADATAAEATAQADAADAPAEPPRKRVCRTKIDNRTGIMAKPQKICRYVDEPATTD